MEADLQVPDDASGVILFAHGSGSSRFSVRNQYVAQMLREAGLGTLLFDLLTHEEEQEDLLSSDLRFDIEFLAERLVRATHWVKQQPSLRGLKIGYFGASTGAAAALVAAAELGDEISAVVSRGGRVDLARDALPKVRCPTLLIVGGLDSSVICLNDDAFVRLRCEKEFRIVPGATHLFEERGRLEQVAKFSAHWFSKHLAQCS